MKVIEVHTPFFLNLPDGTVTPRFRAGVHHVNDDVADHWFTHHHAKVLGESEKTVAKEPAFVNVEGTGSAVPVDADEEDVQEEPSEEELLAQLEAEEAAKAKKGKK